MLLPSIHNSLNELIDLLDQLSDSEYANPCTELSNASIGEHTRHIIEMFLCLENQYQSGIVNYDKRERNIQIQTNSNLLQMVSRPHTDHFSTYRPVFDHLPEFLP